MGGIGKGNNEIRAQAGHSALQLGVCDGGCIRLERIPFVDVSCSLRDRVSFLEDDVGCGRVRSDLAAHSSKAVAHRVVQ